MYLWQSWKYVCNSVFLYVFLTILDVFLPVDKKSGCKNASVGCIYGSNSCMTVLLAEMFIHFDKYTSRCISAGCKNAMYPK